MENNNQYINEDKIDIRELFSIFKKRKKLIWSVTTLLTLIAIIYIVFAKPTYEVKAMIEIGQINGVPIDDINDIQQKLIYEYKVDVKGIKRELPLVKAVTTHKKAKNILYLSIHGNNNEESIKYIQTVINKIEAQYKGKLDAYIQSQYALIELTEKNIDDSIINLAAMKKDLNTYNQKIISLKSEDAALAGIYTIQIGQKEAETQVLNKYISELRNKKEELKLSLTPLMITSTQIVGEIETLDKPIKPKKVLIIFVAFIIGVMLSIFLIFFLEFSSWMKKEKE